MSAQFGIWNFDGKPADREYLEKITARVSNVENELLQLKRQIHS